MYFVCVWLRTTAVDKCGPPCTMSYLLESAVESDKCKQKGGRNDLCKCLQKDMKDAVVMSKGVGQQDCINIVEDVGRIQFALGKNIMCKEQ